jgi:steroid delta-isomerase-like uncharacterized protein
MAPDAIVRMWFEEVWNQGRTDTIDRLMAPSATVHGVAPDGALVRGPEGFKPFHLQFRQAFPDLRVVVEQTVTEGDRVVAYCRVTGTHTGPLLGMPPTGRAVDFCGFTLARVSEGQLVEGWNCFDFLAMQQQLGAIPAPR